MRNALFLFVLSACHVGHLSESEYAGLTIAETASKVSCELVAETYATSELMATVDEYEYHLEGAGIVLVFYEDRDRSEELSLIEVKTEDLKASSESGFWINLINASVNPGVSEYFEDDGDQMLSGSESIWLWLWGMDNGELRTYEILISQAGLEDQTGYCTLLE